VVEAKDSLSCPAYRVHKYEKNFNRRASATIALLVLGKLLNYTPCYYGILPHR